MRGKILKEGRVVQQTSAGKAPAPSSKKYERSKSRRSNPSPCIGLRKSTKPSELNRFVLTTLMTSDVETALPVEIVAVPCPPSALLSPVAAFVSPLVESSAALSVSLVTKEPLVTPG